MNENTKPTVTQQELAEMTGIASCYVSEALHGMKPALPSRPAQYKTDEAAKAIIEFSNRRKQIVAEAAARKIAKWDSTIAAANRLLEGE